MAQDPFSNVGNPEGYIPDNVASKDYNPDFAAEWDKAQQRGSLNRGFQQGASGVAESLKYAGAGYANLFGLDSAKNYLIESAKRNELMAEANAPRVGRLEDIQNLSDVGSYAAGALGQAIPSIGLSAVSGGVGGFGARLAARGAAGRLAGGLEGAAGKALLAERTALGAKAGGFGANYLMQQGEMYKTTMENGTPDFGLASLAAVPAAYLDYVTEVKGVQRALGNTGGYAGKTWKDSVKDITKGGLQGAGLEGSTEALQQGIQIGVGNISANLDPNRYNGEYKGDAVSEILNAFAGGAIPGFGFGSAANVSRQVRQALQTRTGGINPNAAPEAPVGPTTPLGFAPEQQPVEQLPSAVPQPPADLGLLAQDGSPQVGRDLFGAPLTEPATPVEAAPVEPAAVDTFTRDLFEQAPTLRPNETLDPSTGEILTAPEAPEAPVVDVTPEQRLAERQQYQEQLRNAGNFSAAAKVEAEVRGLQTQVDAVKVQYAQVTDEVVNSALSDFGRKKDGTLRKDTLEQAAQYRGKTLEELTTLTNNGATGGKVLQRLYDLMETRRREAVAAPVAKMPQTVTETPQAAVPNTQLENLNAPETRSITEGGQQQYSPVEEGRVSTIPSSSDSTVQGGENQTQVGQEVAPQIPTPSAGYAKALAASEKALAALQAAAAKLDAFPKLPSGLTTDEAKASSAWKAAYNAQEVARKALQDANSYIYKKHRKEHLAYQRAVIDKRRADILAANAAPTPEVVQAAAQTPATLSEAARLLGAVTGGRFTVSNLAGAANADTRQRLMSALVGKPVPKSQSGVNRLTEEFYRQAGIPLDTSAGMEARFAEVAKTLSGQSTPTEPLASRTTSAEGTDQATILKQVQPILARWKNAPLVQVVQSSADVPGYNGVEFSGAFDPKANVVYLVAGNLSPEQVEFTLLHEVAGHYGLRGLLGDKLNTALDIAGTNAEVSRRADAIQKEFGYERRLAIEEALSDLAGTPKPPTVVEKFIQAVYKALQALGLSEYTTVADVKDLLAGSRRYVEMGAKDIPPLFTAKQYNSAVNNINMALTQEQVDDAFAAGARPLDGVDSLRYSAPFDGREEAMVSEKEFYRGYSQHIDLRGAKEGTALSNIDKIKSEGFKSSFLNVLPPSRGGQPTNVIDQAFYPKKGKVVYFVPNSQTKNGKVVSGWRPKPYEVAVIEYDGQPAYELYKSAFEKNNSAPFDGREIATTPLDKTTQTILVDGVERPAQNSNGQPIHWSEEGTRNFWHWFGESKVVDAQGRPLVVYHGTQHVFDAFDKPGRAGAQRLNYFAADPEVAGDYSKTPNLGSPNIIPAYIAAAKPFVFNADGQQWAAIDSRGIPAGIMSRIPKENILRGGLVGFTDINLAARDAGYTGVIANNIVDGGGQYGSMTPTTVVVVSDPNQIKSAVGNSGQFNPATGNILMSQTGAPTTPESRFNKAKFTAQDYALRGNYVSQRAKLFMYTLTQINESYSKKIISTKERALEILNAKAEETNDTKLVQAIDQMLGRTTEPDVRANPMQEYERLGNLRAAEANRIQGRAATMFDKWKDSANAQQINDVMLDATMSNVAVDKTFEENAKWGADRANYDRVTTAFNALPDADKTIYFEVRALLRQTRLDEIDAVLKAAKAAGNLLPGDIAMMNKYREQFREIKGDYFPLRRDGKWIVQGVDGAGDRVVRFAKTEAEARLLAQQFNGTVNLKKNDETGYNNAANSVFVDKVAAAISEKFGDPNIDRQVREMLNEVYLAATPDGSALKARMKRDNVKGADKNMLYAVSATIQSSAYYLASQEYSPKMNEQARFANLIHDTLNKAGYYGDQSGDLTQAMEAFNRSHNDNKAVQDTPIADFFGKLGFTYMLGSISHAIANAFQVPTLAAPFFYGKHAAGAVMKALGSKYVDYIQISKLRFMEHPLDAEARKAAEAAGQKYTPQYKWYSPLGPLLDVNPETGKYYLDTMTDAQGMPIGQDLLIKAMGENKEGVDRAVQLQRATAKRDMLRKLSDEGRLDTMGHDLGDFAKGKMEKTLLDRFVQLAAFPAHESELMNKVITALAAFDLAAQNPDPAVVERATAARRLLLDQGRTKEEANAAYNAIMQRGATAYADEAVVKTQFVQTAGNRSEAMRNSFIRTMFMFQQYRFNMIYTLAHNAKLAFAGEDADTRRQAQRFIGSYLATTLALTGTAGVVGVSTSMAIVSALMNAFGDDEPDDLEADFRTFLTNNLGEGTASTINKGLLRGFGLIPFDLSNRIDASKILYNDSTRDLPQGGWARQIDQLALSQLGAGYSLGRGFFDGMDMITQGQVQKGMEKLLPKGVSDLSRAQRLYSEGYTNRAGYKVLDMNVFEVASQAIGLSPADVVDYNAEKSARDSAKYKVEQRRNSLLAAYALAVTSGDSDGRKAIQEKINEFNQTVPSRKVPYESLQRAVSTRNKNQAMLERDQYVTNKGNRYLLTETEYGNMQ